MALEDELFFKPMRCHYSQRGNDVLNMLRDLALGELAGLTKGKH